MADLTPEDPAMKTLISRLARFEPINLTALMLNEPDNNPQRQQCLEFRARIILETALEWFPKPSLVLSSTNMQHFEKRSKAFAAACNFLADNPVALDEVVYDRKWRLERQRMKNGKDSLHLREQTERLLLADINLQVNDRENSEPKSQSTTHEQDRLKPQNTHTRSSLMSTSSPVSRTESTSGPVIAHSSYESMSHRNTRHEIMK